MFVVTREQPHGKLYLRRDAEGELTWTPSAAKAHGMPKPDAAAAAAEINLYASTAAAVERV